MAPNKSIPASQINLGAIFTAAGWIITTEIYSYYISHFARYDIFYAGLSNIAVLMLWIYFLSCILVIGLSLTVKFDNDEMEKLEELISSKMIKILMCTRILLSAQFAS